MLTGGQRRPDRYKVRLLRRDDVDGCKIRQSTNLLEAVADLRYRELAGNPPARSPSMSNTAATSAWDIARKRLQMAFTEIPTTDHSDSDSVHECPSGDNQ